MLVLSGYGEELKGVQKQSLHVQKGKIKAAEIPAQKEPKKFPSQEKKINNEIFL